MIKIQLTKIMKEKEMKGTERVKLTNYFDNIIKRLCLFFFFFLRCVARSYPRKRVFTAIRALRYGLLYKQYMYVPVESRQMETRLRFR